MTFHDHIRESRVYSYAMSIFASILLYQVVQWVITIDLNTVSMAGAGLATSTLAALIALAKFTYDFAKHKPPKDPST